MVRKVNIGRAIDSINPKGIADNFKQRNLVTITELLRTQSDKTYPLIFIGDLMLDPRAGSPQLEQSGPITPTELACMCKPMLMVSLSVGRGHRLKTKSGAYS